MITATIHERGNGWPNAGDYVQGDNGELYRVVTMGSRIVALATAGADHRIPGCVVEPADWSDCEGEPFPAKAVIEVQS